MKNITFIVLVLIFSFIISGCVNKKENDQSYKKIIKKEITCNCIDNCWTGEKKLIKKTLEGKFPLDTKNDVEYFIKQLHDKDIQIGKLGVCNVLSGKKCWSFSFNHPDSYLENGAAYGGCSYPGEINIETGDIDEGGQEGSLRTSP